MPLVYVWKNLSIFPGLAFLPLPILVSRLSHLVDYFAVPIFLKYIINLQQTTFARLVSIWVLLLFCIHPLPYYYQKIYKLFLPTFYILGTADRLHFYSYSLFSFSEYFCLLQEHFCGLGQTSGGFSALPGNIHSISQSIHSNILKVDSADDFAFYFTENMISVRRKLYPPANNFTTYIPMYLYTLCFLLLQSIEQSYSYWGHYTYIFDLIQFLLLKDFCSCKYITSFLHHQNFPIKGLFPLPCKHNIIFSMQNKQHTHN